MGWWGWKVIAGKMMVGWLWFAFFEGFEQMRACYSFYFVFLNYNDKLY